MRILALVFALVVSVVLAIPNVLLHSQTTSLQTASPERDRLVLAELAFVHEAIEHGAARQMQGLYPEVMDFEFTYPTGAMVKPPRGSGQTLMLRFLGEVDPAFAKAQYDRLRQEFYTTRVGLHLVREFPASDPGEADYDSGPVIWDIGSSATILSLGTARAFGDSAFAEALEKSINFYGLPYDSQGKRIYALGLMPVADAFLAWSRVALPNPKLVEARPNIVHPFDHGWIHLLSLLVAAAAWMPWFFLGARRRRG